MKDRLKEKYLLSFHKVHLGNQMLDLRQSTTSVSNYINSFELTQRCNHSPIDSRLIDRPKKEVTLFAPYSLD